MPDKKKKTSKEQATEYVKVKRRERPLSPHLSIYKPQITSVLSIAHRISGIFLFLGVLLFAFWLMKLAFWPQCNCVIALLSTVAGQVFVIGWLVSLYYHLFSGIRHLFWDMGKGFQLKTVTFSGVIVILATIICSVLTWLVAYRFIDLSELL